MVGVGAERDDYLLWQRDDPPLLAPRDGGRLGRHDALRPLVEIELLATEAQADLGVVPAEDAAGCRKAPVVDEAFFAAVADGSGPPTTTSPPSSTSSKRRSVPGRLRGSTSADVVRRRRHGAVLGHA